LAKKLDRLGCRLICWDIDAEGLETLKKKLNPQILHVFQVVDVSDQEEIHQAFAKSPVQEVDIVIANAGVVSGKGVQELNCEDYHRTIDVNLHQHFYLFKKLRLLLESRPASLVPPTFVMVASVCGLMSLTHLADYSSSKFGLVGLAEGIRLDLRKERSRINTLLIMPFLIDTKMFTGISVKKPASWFLSPLKKGDVSDSIIEGIISKRQWLVLPFILRFTPLLLVLPISIRNLLYDMIQESSYMDDFQGKPKLTAREKRQMPGIAAQPGDPDVEKKRRVR
jgi:all-trans-retinol dehydrogenase (NAD+)